MNDDGTMARLPDLIEFAAEHGLKIGTIADLIDYRSRNESLVQRGAERDIETAWGRFRLVAYRDMPSGATHLALRQGDDQPQREALVRVHEPLSVLDLLDAGAGAPFLGRGRGARRRSSAPAAACWCCSTARRADEALRAQFDAHCTGQPPRAAGPQHGPAHLRHRRPDPARPGRRQDAADGAPRKMPSMAGFGLEVTGYAPAAPDESANDRAADRDRPFPVQRGDLRRAARIGARAS